MTLEEAKAVLRERVYGSTKFLEELDASGKLSGDAFLVRKRIADFAVQELENLWRETSRDDLLPIEQSS